MSLGISRALGGADPSIWLSSELDHLSDRSCFYYIYSPVGRIDGSPSLGGQKQIVAKTSQIYTQLSTVEKGEGTGRLCR